MLAFSRVGKCLESTEVRYLLHCRVLAKAVQLQGEWFVSEVDTVTLRAYR